MARIGRMEKDRRYCGHGLQHLLDVARTGWILTLENHYPISKDVVYAAALLHDIGKGRQYEFGIPHHIASAELAEPVLKDCGYSSEEIQDILDAIRLHRKPTDEEAPLIQVLYTADKKTRLCFACEAQDDCNWSAEKKNLRLVY
ncbi:MAG: HD domain-containing protein [Lachnospiraceae bacterium]|nr:HD domain-containing protein [Lachnospiraceae bacterium]